jgi:hypothetical protein
MTTVIQPKFSDAQLRFINSTATIAALIGPQGEGKTFGGFWGMVQHSRRFSGKMRGAVIRDTFENIKNTTIPSIRDASQNEALFSAGGKKMNFMNVEVDLFGIDDLASLSKLQGAEYTFVWLEEPAPIAEKANAGLREEVFDISLSRISRQRDSVPRMQITMNPADEDHWTYHKLIEDPHNDKYIKTEIVQIPYGENWVLRKEQRELVKMAYKHRPDLYARYVEGKFSFVAIGESVTPEYDEKKHRAKKRLDPMEKVSVFRLWDGGLNPTCVFLQITPSGKLHFLDTVRGENMGVKQLIQTRIKPLLERRYYYVDEWRDIGDPSMANREQSDSSQSAAEIIHQELDAVFEKGESNWENRREALREMFTRDMALLSPHEGVLHRAFRGGWHYHKDPSGRVLKDKPVKDIHSHPGDAVSHGVARILIRPKINDRLRKLRQLNKEKFGMEGTNDTYRDDGRRVYL